MTRRERILAASVGAALALGAVAKATQWAVVGLAQSLKKEYRDAVGRKEHLAALIRKEGGIESQWQTQTRCTLAVDPNEAELRFREALDRLLEANGLREELTIKSLQQRPLKNGFIEIPLSIRARGDLAAVAGFLRDFYEQPFLGRLDRVALTCEEGLASRKAGGRTSRTGRRSAPAGSAAHGGPKLAVNLVAATVVLPRVPKVDHPVLPQEIPGDLVVARLAHYDDPTPYGEIVDRNIFKVYEPPVVVAVKQPESPSVVAKPTDRREPAAPPPPQRPDMTLVGVESRNGEVIATARDDRKAGDPPQEFKVNDAVDDGKLILVHPTGIVVRTPGNRQGHAPPVDYFYPLGASFRDRERLDPLKHAHLMRWLRRSGTES